MKTTLLTGMIMTATGLFIRYQIGRRRFNRRGVAGLQQFPSYGKFIFISFVERFIYFTGTLCLLTGFFLLAVAGFNHFKL